MFATLENSATVGFPSAYIISMQKVSTVVSEASLSFNLSKAF